jgi:NADP-dependent 3-hydroxy acid dehydrogenase YdfG
MSQEIAVVTGASSGIGAATARILAESGYHVIAAARRADRLQEVAASHPNIEAFLLDVTSQESVNALAEHLKNKNLSILINNAGGAFDSASVENSDPAIWSKTYEVNVVGAMRVTQALLSIMKQFGRGHLLFTTSTAGHAAYENGGSYVSAKAAEVAMVATLRLELNGLPIRVTEIAPGMVKTEEFSSVRFSGDLEKAAKVYQGVEHPLVAEDIAEAIRWAVTLPHHVNIDSMIVRPIAQAANHKVHRI